MNDFKDRVNFVGILLNLIKYNKELYLRDIASHIIVLLIDAEKFEKVEADGRDLMNMVMKQKDLISNNALSFAILTLVKKNELAAEFSSA